METTMAAEPQDSGENGAQTIQRPLAATDSTDDRKAFLQNFDDDGGGGGGLAYRLTWGEVVLGVAAVVGWVAFFSGGTVVGTENYRLAIDEQNFSTLAAGFRAWFAVVTCYTITNLAFLAG